MDVMNLGEVTVGRAVFEPGWRWFENVKPIAGTDTGQVAHVGYVVSRRMVVRMDDAGEPGGKTMLDQGDSKEWLLVGVAGGLFDGDMVLFWDTQRPSFGKANSV